MAAPLGELVAPVGVEPVRQMAVLTARQTPVVAVAEARVEALVLAVATVVPVLLS